MANASNRYSGAPAPAAPSEKIMTPANVVTLVRICLVPVFVAALVAPWPELLGLDHLLAFKPWIAAAIFVVISCTDWLDGYLARSRNEVTDFGKFMDPLADKVLVVAALLVLIELGSLPSWPVLIIVAREFIVSGVRMVAASKGEVIAASWYGKFKTVFQMIAIVLFVVKESPIIESVSHTLYVGVYLLSWLVMTVALVLTVFSMLDYISKARHLIGFRPKGEGKAGAAHGEEAHACDSEADAAECGEQNSDDVHAIAQRVIARATERGASVGTAESCTGGLIAAALTDVPGASAAFEGSIVSYANEVKTERLGVAQKDLQQHGAVSEEVAVQMAQGARAALGVDVAVSVTGIAGPGGAAPGKPVGTVWIGIATPAEARATLHHFSGNRADVRNATVCEALVQVERALGLTW